MRYIVGFLIVIGLIFLGILLLIRLFFGGGSDAPSQAKLELVANAGTSKTVQLTIDGPINSNEEHKQVKIEVGNNQTRIDLISGYQGQAVKTETFNNNSSAYASFLRAIDLLGYTTGNDSEALEDERGYCPRGQRYIFETKDGSQVPQRYWSTSCGGTASFSGNTNDIVTLFRAQIPNYNEVARGYNF